MNELEKAPLYSGAFLHGYLEVSNVTTDAERCS